MNVRTWLLVITVALLSACDAQEASPILVTSTAARVAQSASATPTLVPSEATALPTRTPIAGDGSFIGSVLEPNRPIPSNIPALPTLTPTPEGAATATLVPTATPAIAVPTLDKAQMGIQVYYNMGVEDFTQVLWLAQQIDVGWVKFQVDWSFFQPNSPDEDADIMRAFVLYVQGAKNGGFKTLLSVAKAPNWARNSNQTEDGPPDDPQALGRFLARLLEQIKPENVDAIEIWNEPNLLREWYGALPFSGAGYMQLFRPTYDAIKAISPNIHVITAGLAPTSNTAGSLDDRVFLQQMYDEGLANYPDVSVGVHPYSWGNAADAVCCNAVEGRDWDDNPRFFFLDTLNDTRAIMERNNHAMAQMWVTEFGWATWEGFPNEAPEFWMTYNSALQQAEYTLRAFEIGAQREDVGLMVLWNLNFANQTLIEARSEMAAYSLLAPNLTGQGEPLIVRPLYRALENRR